MILLGDPGKLEMEIIDRIYPDRIDLDDGKWLYVNLIVNIPCFTSRIYHSHVRIGELIFLYHELNKVLKSTKNLKIDFQTIEENLTMVVNTTISGLIHFDITVQENFNKLSFSLDVDIPSLEQFLNGLFIELRKYTNKLSH